MRLVLSLCGLLVAGLIVAGCGGSEDSSSASSISKEEFIVKADAVCKRSNQRMEAAFVDFLKDKKSLKKLTQAENEKLVGIVLVPNIEREIKELKALGVPDGDDEVVEAIVSALEEGLETAEDNPQVVAASSSDTIFGIASRLAGEYGATVCGSR
jgi:ABC-type Fe3+-citrate transport system substrate-binding protein